MHLYVIAKGIKPHLDTWMNELLAQKLPVFQKGKEKYVLVDGVPTKVFIQLAVRPVQLFEIGFPREHLDYVMSIVGTGDYIQKRYPLLKMTANAVRKVTGMKQVPSPIKVNSLMQPNAQGKAVAVIPIGIKEDAYNAEGQEQL